jgi:hypothetical protein
MDEPNLIIQVPRGGAIDRQVSAKTPASVAAGEIVVETGPTDAEGVLEPLPVGKVVASCPSPESLRREAVELRRVISLAGPGVEPLVVIVEAGEELRDDELSAALEAASHSSRAVILRVMRDA